MREGLRYKIDLMKIKTLRKLSPFYNCSECVNKETEYNIAEDSNGDIIHNGTLDVQDTQELERSMFWNVPIYHPLHILQLSTTLNLFICPYLYYFIFKARMNTSMVG